MKKITVFLFFIEIFVHTASVSSTMLETKLDVMAEKVLSCKDIVGFSLGIVKNGSVLFTKGYGIANREKETPATPDTLYGIASLSKAFASTLISKLLHDHKQYTLDTPVKQILGENFYFADPILTTFATVRDLLSHRTGIPKYNRVRILKNFDREELVRKMRFFNSTAKFRYSYIYNNLMYGLISRITEIIGGDSWENLLKEHIFNKLQMNSTTFTHTIDFNREDMAVPYMRLHSQGWKAVSQHLHRVWGRLGGSGAVVSSVNDMIKWLKFQLSLGMNENGEQVVPADVLRETHQGVISIPECKACYYYRRPYSNITYEYSQYALGWRTGFYRGLPIITHTGSSFGYTAILTLLMDLNIGIHLSITGNDPGFEGRKLLHSYIMDILLEEDPVVTLENVCYFPYNNPKPNTNTTDNNPTKALTEEESMMYIGMYGNPGFGNLTIYYNEGLKMKYGIGFWNLYLLQDPHQFTGQGLDDIWNVRIDLLEFQLLGRNGLMSELIIPSFERANPPIFKRNFKMSDVDTADYEVIYELAYTSGVGFTFVIPQLCLGLVTVLVLFQGY